MTLHSGRLERHRGKDGKTIAFVKVGDDDRADTGIPATLGRRTVSEDDVVNDPFWNVEP